MDVRKPVDQLSNDNHPPIECTYHDLLRDGWLPKGDYLGNLIAGSASKYLSEEPRSALRSYVGTYLTEEIAAEGLARNLPSFTRFLDLAAHCNATIVNHSNLASDAQVPRTTVHGYFDILRDTLIAHELPAWRRSGKRKTVVSSKWYFFDMGVVSALQSQSVHSLPRRDGFAFETWLHHELRSWIDYRDRGSTSNQS